MNITGVDNILHHRKGSSPWIICIYYAIRMEQETDRFYPSAPFEKNELEQRLEKT